MRSDLTPDDPGPGLAVGFRNRGIVRLLVDSCGARHRRSAASLIIAPP